MSIKNTKLSFRTGKISKVSFINQMHDFHKVLFDFAENLKGTEISKVEIKDGLVIFTTRTTEYHPGGCKFYVDVIDKRVTPIDTFNFDMYEKEDSEMLFKLVDSGDTIFDIGTNIGWYSIHLARKFPNSTIHSFEPIPETFTQVKRNVELNEITNIKINNIALSNKKENLIFFYSPNVTGASSSKNITEDSNMFKLECQADTIDNYILTNKVLNLDFIKCDVEGAEYFVFQGGFETFKNHQPIVFTEMLRKWSAKFGYHPNDIVTYFSQFGYKCFVSSSGKLKLVDQINDNTTETNFFFLHPIKHLNKLITLT
jgi:FkbM family methyltransferase